MSHRIFIGEEVPKDSNLAKEDQGPTDLHQNLLEKNKEDRYKYQRMIYLGIFNFNLLLEFYFFYIITPLTLFEYCYWDFNLKKYEEVEFFPANDQEMGDIKDVYQDLECDLNRHEVCPGLCDVASDIDDALMYAEVAIFSKFFIAAIGYFVLAYFYKKVNVRHAQLIFAIIEGLSFLSLIIGVFLYFYIGDFSRFGDTEIDAANDKPLAFRFRAGAYVTAAVFCWIFTFRAIIIYFFKDIDHRFR